MAASFRSGPFSGFADALTDWMHESPWYLNASVEGRVISDRAGIVASDADLFIDETGRSDLLVIVRCPKRFMPSHVDSIESQDALPKPSHIKIKTGDFGSVDFQGRRYVSDYDLMCIYRRPNRRERRAESEIANQNSIISKLNDRLLVKIQHGCNDFWVDGNRRPKYLHIGKDFIVFDCGNWKTINSIRELRQFYEENAGMVWYPEYENPGPLPPADGTGASYEENRLPAFAFYTRRPGQA